MTPTIPRYTITAEGASPGYFRLVEDPAGAWCTFAERDAERKRWEALLLQRAQEIAELTEENTILHNTCGRHEENLMRRAQEIEQVKAEQITRVIQRVAELPDRTSPDDWPEAMLVTADELRDILMAEAALVSRAPQPELGQWAHDELCAYTKKAQATTDPHERRYWEGWAGCLYNLRNKPAEGAAPLPASTALQAFTERLLQRIESGGHFESIGSIDNTRVLQIGVDEIARWRSELEAALSRADRP